MLQKAFKLCSSGASTSLRSLVSVPSQPFTYDHREMVDLKKQVQRKLHALRMFTDLKEFNYETPDVSYDRKTGEIKIKQKAGEKKKKILRTMDEVEREKKALLKEAGLGEDGKQLDENEPVDKLAEKIKKVNDKIIDDYDIDPAQFYVFSRDYMRCDVGLIIQRAPIFLTLRKRDIEYMKYKNDIMNEYNCNLKQFSDEFGELSKLNEDILGDNPYGSKMNLDNYPTHRFVDPKTNEVREYCASSKYFVNVDPNMEDRKSIHYAAEDRTYFIVRNKYTKEWEFPTSKIYFGQTFLRAKQNLFNGVGDGNWKVKYFGNGPIVATLREFTQSEKQDINNNNMKGVRTYYFQAHHWRGLPGIKVDGTDYDDFLWIPKRQLNEYFARDYYDVFINGCLTR